MTELGIDCIVVNYRCNDDLDRFVESFRQTAPDYASLIVMDVDPISPYGYKNVPGRYKVIPDNNGYAYACNLGATLGNSPYVAFFNSDIKLMDGTIDNIVRAMEENPTWGVVGPMQYDDAGRVTHAGVFGTHAKPAIRGWKSHNKSKFRDVQKAITVFGSAFFMPREVFRELTECPIFQEQHPGTLGAFLPTFLYYEETWVSYHAWSHGYDVVYYGLSECIHKWHGTINKTGDRNCVGESRKVFREMCDAHSIPRD